MKLRYKNRLRKDKLKSTYFSLNITLKFVTISCVWEAQGETMT